MMHTPQIGDSAAQRPSLALDALLPAFALDSGLLGNRMTQGPTPTTAPEFAEEEVWLVHFFRKQFADSRPASKLVLLKRHTFTAEGREGRVRRSLAALNAQQPTSLTLEQWKETVAEAEEDDDED